MPDTDGRQDLAASHRREDSGVSDAPRGWLSRMLGRSGPPREKPPTAELAAISPTDDDRLVGERFRTLAWKLDRLQRSRPFRVITITSSVEGEGKSTVALNLAAVMAERARGRVLLVDCDMRRPRLLSLLGGTGEGLESLLGGRCTFDEALNLEAELGLHYVLVRRPVQDPLRLLSSPQCLQRLVEVARARYDYVILDTPPVLPVHDAIFLADASDAVLFVTRAGETSGRMLSRALGALKREKLLGIVFNGSARPMNYGYGQYAPYEHASRPTGEVRRVRLQDGE